MCRIDALEKGSSALTGTISTTSMQHSTNSSVDRRMSDDKRQRSSERLVEELAASIAARDRALNEYKRACNDARPECDQDVALKGYTRALNELHDVQSRVRRAKRS